MERSGIDLGANPLPLQLPPPVDHLQALSLLDQTPGPSADPAFTPTDWGQVPLEVAALIVTHLSPRDLSAARLVCRQWRGMISSAALHLRPRAMPCSGGKLAALFPWLQEVDLRRCRGMRDANLKGLSDLKALRTLKVDGRDGLTDDSVAHMAKIPLLTALSLQQCVQIGAPGLAALCGKVQRVGQLTPRRGNSSGPQGHLSPRTSSFGRQPGGLGPATPRSSGDTEAATAPQQLPTPPLQFLDLTGCMCIPPSAFSCLSALTGLTELHLGGAGRASTVADETLAAVAACTALRVLDMAGGNVTDTGLLQLTSLTGLVHLSLWNFLGITSRGLDLLTCLPLLADLRLRGCKQLTDGGMAHGLAAATALRRLDCRTCENLQGDFLGALGRLTKLTELNMEGCYRVNDNGLAQLAALTHLQALHLQDCWQITHNGLGRLHTLTALTAINLQGCRNVRGPLPQLSSLLSLAVLNLGNCVRLADGGVGFMASLSNLHSLDLSGCRELSGAALAPLAKASRLQALRLQHCPGLKGPSALRHLESITCLTSLHLCECTGLVGTALTSLRGLSRLRTLSLEGCNSMPLMDRGLAAVGQGCGALTSISLQSCTLLDDAGVAELGQLTMLQSANLTDCPGITGAGFASWSAMRCLTSLQLLGCKSLDDAGAANLGALHNLRHLNMRLCRKISAEGIQAMAPGLQHLTALSLQGMDHLTDTGLAALTSLRSLEDLELHFCFHFGTPGIKELATQLTALSRLDLLYNWNITDEALQAVVGMSSLVSLSLRGCNRLTAGAMAAAAHLLSNVHPLN